MEELVLKWSTKSLDDLGASDSIRSNEIILLFVGAAIGAFAIATIMADLAEIRIYALTFVILMGSFTFYAFYQDTYRKRIFQHTLTKTTAEVYSYDYYPNWFFALGKYGWIAYIAVGLIGTFIVGPVALAGAAGMGLVSALSLRKVNTWEKTKKEDMADTDPWSLATIDRCKMVIHLQREVPAKRNSIISMGRWSFIESIGGYDALPERTNTNEAAERKIKRCGLGIAIETVFSLDEFLNMYSYDEEVRTEIEERGLKKYTEVYGPGPYFDGPHLFAQHDSQLNDILNFVKTHINPEIEIREEAIGAPRPYWYCFKDWLKGLANK